jgi:hypothetical protein
VKPRTSLKAVAKTLLAEVEGSELAQLKADVDRMSADLDQAGLERRLLSYLHEAIAAAEPAPGPARVLAGPDRLAVLLLDPHVRGYLLRPGTAGGRRPPRRPAAEAPRQPSRLLAQVHSRYIVGRREVHVPGGRPPWTSGTNDHILYYPRPRAGHGLRSATAALS